MPGVFLIKFGQYGCPEELPTVKNPNPKQAPPDGESERHRREFLIPMSSSRDTHPFLSPG